MSEDIYLYTTDNKVQMYSTEDEVNSKLVAILGDKFKKYREKTIYPEQLIWSMSNIDLKDYVCETPSQAIPALLTSPSIREYRSKTCLTIACTDSIFDTSTSMAIPRDSPCAIFSKAACAELNRVLQTITSAPASYIDLAI